MVKKILVLFLVICGTTAGAQTDPDSLRNVWNDESLADTSRMNALRKLIFDHYVFPNPDSSIILSNELLDWAGEAGQRKFEAEAHNALAVGYSKKGDDQSAIENNQMGLEIAAEISDSLVLGKCISDLGVSYLNMGRVLDAYNAFQKGRTINKAIGNKLYESYNIGNLGNVYYNLGEFERAKEMYLEHLEINRTLNDKQATAAAAGNLGDVYKELGDTAKAIDQYHKGLKLARESEFMQIETIANLNLADIYTDLNKLELATEHVQEMKRLVNLLGSPLFQAVATILDCKIEYAKGNYSTALSKCEIGHQMIIPFQYPHVEIEAVTTLYQVNKKLKNSDVALRYHEQMLELQKNIQTDEAKTEIQRIEFNNQLKADSLAQIEKERQIELAHQEEVRKKNRTKNILLGSGLILMLIAGTLFSQNRQILRSRQKLQLEKDRSENLLLNILPAEVAEELKEKGQADARDFEIVSILFTDFKEFTETSEKFTATELVNEINYCFSGFDMIMEQNGVEKIKTIGDAYMAAGGLPVPSDNSTKRTVKAALEMQDFIKKRKLENDKQGMPAFEMRVGIHTGPVVAGIVGVKKFQYDIWGDTVNTANRMETNSEPGRVNISRQTYELIKNNSDFSFESRGYIEAKGKGEIEMWFVNYKSIS